VTFPRSVSTSLILILYPVTATSSVAAFQLMVTIPSAMETCGSEPNFGAVVSATSNVCASDQVLRFPAASNARTE